MKTFAGPANIVLDGVPILLRGGGWENFVRCVVRGRMRGFDAAIAKLLLPFVYVMAARVHEILVFAA